MNNQNTNPQDDSTQFDPNNGEQKKQTPSETKEHPFGKPYADFIESNIVANKQLRKDLDAQIQILCRLEKSRERSLAITKLEEAVMWLGMDLKRLGAVNPYPNSKSPETGAIVDPTADGLKFSN